MQVSIGQVWEDKDKRRIGRLFKVENIVNDKAVCRVVQAGSAKGKSPVRIRLDRFVPKYYVPKTASIADSIRIDVYKKTLNDKDNIQNSLEQRCSELLGGDWTCPSPRYAQMELDELRVLVREVSFSTYDVKIRFSQHLLSSFVVYDNLQNTILEVKSRLEKIRDNLDKVL